MTVDISDFYLGSGLNRPDYMWLTDDQVPKNIRTRYCDKIIWKQNRIMVRSGKVIYGLPQAARHAKENLCSLVAVIDSIRHLT